MRRRQQQQWINYRIPMRHSLNEIASRVVASLPAEELRRVAVYLDPQPLDQGATLSIRGSLIPVAAPSVVAFIDLQPSANWAHPCRYLLINVDDCSISSIDAQFPPTREQLRLIHQGEGVEDWMLLGTQPL